MNKKRAPRKGKAVEVFHWSLQGKYIKNRLEFDRSMADQQAVYNKMVTLSKLGEQV